MKQKLLPLFLALAAIISCQEEIEIITPVEQGISTMIKTNMDNDFNDFASAVSSALRANNDFRKFIIKEEKKKTDGDYDVIVNDIINKSITVNSTKSEPVEQTIRELLSDHLTMTKSSEESFIDYLVETYPDLQVSVPLLGDEWEDDFVPIVAFIPESFEDGVTHYIPGYDSNGNEILVDAISEPNEPVVIIGRNERSCFGQQDNSNSTTLPRFLLPPSNLQATQSSQGIILTWESSETSTNYYNIYRKAENQSDYSLIGTSFGVNNKSYIDQALTANIYYHYYVTCVSIGPNLASLETKAHIGPIELPSESAPSNYVLIQAPSVPQSLSYFEAFPTGNGVELRWNNDGQTNYDIEINVQDPYTSLAYQPLANCPATDNLYQYISPIKGRRVVYQAFRSNIIGHSDPVYDYIYPPYRNVDSVSPVYVTSLHVNDVSSLESWVRGAPEFQLKVFGVTASGATVELQNNIELEMDARHGTTTFSNRKIYDWLYSSYGGWYSSLTFYLCEKDGESDMSTNATATYAYKVSDDLQYQNGTSITTNWSNHGQECGRVYIMYYQNPVQTIEFPNFGVTMGISDHRD